MKQLSKESPSMKFMVTVRPNSYIITQGNNTVEGRTIKSAFNKLLKQNPALSHHITPFDIIKIEEYVKERQNA